MSKLADTLHPNWHVYILEVGDLRTDAGWQRPLKATKVSRISQAINPDLLGVIYASFRDGEYWVLDGQHRVAALREAGREDEKLEVFVAEGLTVEREAYIHGALNKFRSEHTPVELFNTFLDAKQPVEVAIDKVLRDRGLAVAAGGDSSEGIIHAVGTLYALHEAGGSKFLGSVLDRCIDAWGYESDAFHGHILKGMGVLVTQYGSVLDAKRLTKALQDERPRRILSDAEAQRRGNKASAPNNVAAVMVVLYNSIRGGKKLPPATELLRPGTRTLKGRKVTLDQKTEIKKRLAKGESLGEIAEALSLTKQQVSRYSK